MHIALFILFGMEKNLLQKLGREKLHWRENQKFLTLVFQGLIVGKGELRLNSFKIGHGVHHPLFYNVRIGKGPNNMTDGVLIATSYLVDVRLGVLTTIAVVIHEIPQEIGDLAILIYSGYSRARALLMNFLSALAAFAGVLIVLSLNSTLPDIEHYLIPVVAGNFLYIAIADLIPELHKQTKLQHSLLQVLGGGAGILVMFLLLSLE